MSNRVERGASSFQQGGHGGLTARTEKDITKILNGLMSVSVVYPYNTTGTGSYLHARREGRGRAHLHGSLRGPPRAVNSSDCGFERCFPTRQNQNEGGMMSTRRPALRSTRKVIDPSLLLR